MQGTWTAVLLLSLLWMHGMVAEEKPISLSDARAAVDANLRTAAGKAYDEQLGKKFAQRHLGPLRQCRQIAGSDLQSF